MTRDQPSRPVHIADSAVMGGLAVRNTAGLLAAAGLAQLTGFQSSMVISEAGGRPLDITWSFCLVLAFTTLLLTRCFRGRPRDAAVVEIVGLVVFIAGCCAYIWAATDDGISGKLVLVAFAGGAAINAAGRGVLLGRRWWWIARSCR